MDQLRQQSLQCSWTLSVLTYLRLLDFVQPFQTVAEDIYIWSVASKCSVNTPVNCALDLLSCFAVPICFSSFFPAELNWLHCFCCGILWCLLSALYVCTFAVLVQWRLQLSVAAIAVNPAADVVAVFSQNSQRKFLFSSYLLGSLCTVIVFWIVFWMMLFPDKMFLP